MLHPVVIDPRMLQAHMTKTIPLGAALRVELDNIVVGNNVIVTALVSFSEIDDSLFKAFTAGDTMIKVIEFQV